MTKNKGFTLIELIIFIVVLSIVSLTILTVTSFALKYTPVEHNQTKAINVSTKCMEYFLGQRHLKSFADVVNNQAAIDFCELELPTGFTVTTTIETATVPNFGGVQAFKLITVETSGPGQAITKMLIADY